mmetsp:Transcript_8829/g.18785  ORF Transcript_8829/g.18785 Transcript_8829/m.18785 type:complete len:94 (+) Transcript_8829:98-379(+)
MSDRHCSRIRRLSTRLSALRRKKILNFEAVDLVKPRHACAVRRIPEQNGKELKPRKREMRQNREFCSAKSFLPKPLEITPQNVLRFGAVTSES